MLSLNYLNYLVFKLSLSFKGTGCWHMEVSLWCEWHNVAHTPRGPIETLTLIQCTCHLVAVVYVCVCLTNML